MEVERKIEEWKLIIACCLVGSAAVHAVPDSAVTAEKTDISIHYSLNRCADGGQVIYRVTRIYQVQLHQNIHITLSYV